MAAKDQLKELEKRVIIGPARGEWFHLAEPDTKFNAAGDYKVTLRPTAEAMAPHFESMKEILAAALPPACQPACSRDRRKGFVGTGSAVVGYCRRP